VHHDAVRDVRAREAADVRDRGRSERNLERSEVQLDDETIDRVAPQDARAHLCLFAGTEAIHRTQPEPRVGDVDRDLDLERRASIRRSDVGLAAWGRRVLDEGSRRAIDGRGQVAREWPAWGSATCRSYDHPRHEHGPLHDPRIADAGDEILARTRTFIAR